LVYLIDWGFDFQLVPPNIPFTALKRRSNMTAKSNNIEITRRTFLEVVFATTTAAAISGAIPL
jgi:hypothetical protein